jgi:PTH1 family peptidyl-tRNA hydrolase
MRLIIGLGNPSDGHKGSRHNVGFVFVDKLITKMDLPLQFDRKFNSDILQTANILYAKPMTFMNSSGIAVNEILNFYKINTENLWIAHDDLDIKLGDFKMQKGKGPKDHKGVSSVEESVGTTDFWRVRIGVDDRKVDHRVPGEEYVLQRFSNEELLQLDKVIEKATNEIIRSIS